MAKEYDVMVIAPHPDDAEMGMGGTMIKLCNSGYSVLSVCLTQGEMGTYGNVDIRRKEFETACRIVGCDSLMLDFPDTGITNDRESRVRLARLMREHKPKIVFAPYYENSKALPRGLVHVDHYTTGELVRDSVKFSRLKKIVPDLDAHEVHKLYFFMVPMHREANLFVDVTDVIEKVQESVKAYSTQMQIQFQDMYIDEAVNKMRIAAGLNIGRPYAERFVTDQPLLLKGSEFFDL